MAVLDAAFDRIEALLPPRLARTLAWMRRPEARWVRISAGLLCILASVFWFLPVVGVEFLPLGLLLLAQDVPFLRKPVGHLVLRLLDALDGVLRWWKQRRARGGSR